MKKKMLFGITILFFGSIFISSAQDLTIFINNIENSTQGNIYIAFFTSQKEFDTQKPSFAKSYEKSCVESGKLKVVVPVKAGVYGLSILDDRNANGKMEYNILGIPKEGFGFSNYDLRQIKMPNFNDFKFNIGHNESKSVAVNMKYIL